MSNLYSKNFDNADEVKTPPKARVDIVQLGNINASKLVLQPGWVWSECIKPTVGGHSCLLYTSPSPRDRQKSRMPSSA